MSIEDEKKTDVPIVLSGWVQSIIISWLCLVLSLLNLPALFDVFSFVQAPFFATTLFIVMLFRVQMIQIIPFLIAVLVYDIVQGFASFYAIMIFLLFVGLHILRRKQFVWSFLTGYFAFAHLVVILELCRFAMVSIFLSTPFSWDIFILSSSMQIVFFPLVFIALAKKDR
jgi:hypothetical protein